MNLLLLVLGSIHAPNVTLVECERDLSSLTNAPKRKVKVNDITFMG